jgi:predicted SnoaL-like aldol condensation-catalyzing enzyme
LGQKEQNRCAAASYPKHEHAVGYGKSACAAFFLARKYFVLCNPRAKRGKHTLHEFFLQDLQIFRSCSAGKFPAVIEEGKTV